MNNCAPLREELQHLRQKINKIENRQTNVFDGAFLGQENKIVSYPNRSDENIERKQFLPFEYEPLDQALHGGIPLAALTEFRCDETRQTGVASAFVWIMAQRMQRFLSQQQYHAPIIWIGDISTRLGGGDIYPPGLMALGVDPLKCLFVQPRSLHDALWAAELAAKQQSIAATILEVRGNPDQLDMAGTRRLQLRAQVSKRPFFLLRQNGQAEATAARIRIDVQPATAAARILSSHHVLPHNIGNPAFSITLEKSYSPQPQSFILEWNNDTQSFNFPTRTHNTSCVSNIDLRQKRTQNFGAGLSLSSDRSDQADQMGRVVAFR